MHRDFCVGRLYDAIRFLARAAQGVRHRGACISINFGRMAELATTRSRGLSQGIWRVDLCIGAPRDGVVGLSTPKGPNAYENYQSREKEWESAFQRHWFSHATVFRPSGIVPLLSLAE